jgi:tetratricopeptide (TPR) repeat protein
VLDGHDAQAVAQAEQSMEQASKAIAEAAPSMRSPAPGPNDLTLATLIEQGEQAIKQGQFADAKALFGAALHLSKSRPDSDLLRHDPYLIQRLVLATYKALQPDELSALNEAIELLTPLAPEDSNDPETVGLAGAIEKWLFDKGQGADHLDRAIWYYGRGYCLRNDWYNGINLAYLLTVRIDTPLDWEQQFWCLATKAEVHCGLGELEAYEQTRAEAQTLKQADWMMATFDGQIGRLRPLLEKHGHLLNPPWSGGTTVGPATA